MLRNFAPVFDCGFYRQAHSDLAAFPDEDLRQHYSLHGKTEGRVCTPVHTTRAFLDEVDGIRPLLEIGPYTCPGFRGEGVRYVDAFSADDLRDRARHSPGRDPANVPECIDYVATNLQGIAERFEMVFSSHSVEHQPDLLQHLLEVATVLKAGGVYALLIPDCRFTFDHFLPPSNLAEVYAAHGERRQRHTLRKVVEHRALTTHNDPSRHWAGDHGVQNFDLIQAAIAEHTAGDYVDVHAWQFTPDSFETLCSHFEPMTKLRPLRVYQTSRGNLDFGAILQKHD